MGSLQRASFQRASSRLPSRAYKGVPSMTEGSSPRCSDIVYHTLITKSLFTGRLNTTGGFNYGIIVDNSKRAFFLDRNLS